MSSRGNIIVVPGKWYYKNKLHLKANPEDFFEESTGGDLNDDIQELRVQDAAESDDSGSDLENFLPLKKKVKLDNRTVDWKAECQELQHANARLRAEVGLTNTYKDQIQCLREKVLQQERTIAELKLTIRLNKKVRIPNIQDFTFNVDRLSNQAIRSLVDLGSIVLEDKPIISIFQ